MAKNKQKNSKDTFRRELQKEPKPRSGAEGDENFQWKSKWPFFKIMLFCKDVLLLNSTSGNLPDVDNDFENDQDRNSTNGTSCSEDTYIDVGVNLEHAEYSGTSSVTMENADLANNSFQQRRKKSRKNEESNINSYLVLEQKKILFLENAQKKENELKNDSDYQFLVSLLPYLKDLNALEKLEVRHNIQSVVIAAHRQKQISSSASNAMFFDQVKIKIIFLLCQ